MRSLWWLALLASAVPPGGAAQVPAAGGTREPLRIVVVGDINLARAVARDYIVPGHGAKVFASVRRELRAADLAIGNLESVIVDRGVRW